MQNVSLTDFFRKKNLIKLKNINDVALLVSHQCISFVRLVLYLRHNYNVICMGPITEQFQGGSAVINLH